MKAVTEPCVRPAELGLRTETHFKVAKTTKADDAQHTAEMQECFSKLRELVPSIPPNKRLSRTALLQHVIDYILDLECTLDRHPVNQTPFSATPSPATRSPLSEKSEPNTLVSSGSDVEDEIRPVSK